MALCACQPNSAGVGTGSIDSLGEDATAGDPTDADSTAGDPATSAATSVASADGSSGGPPPATSATTGAELQFVESDAVNFGNVDVGGTAARTLAIQNVGDETAVGLGATLEGDFGYTGGSYPGATGDCGDALAASESCTLELSFSPASLGAFAGSLAVAHDGGAPLQGTLAGVGAGRTDNLLVNPGGEDGASPTPSGWNQIGDGTWVARDYWVDAASGNWYISADNGPNNEPFRLRQSVDVSQWADLIDSGPMRFSFSGLARSWQNGNDDYRVTLRYRNDQGDLLDEWSSPWDSGTSWTTIEHSRTVPEGTRRIDVDLGGRKSFGDDCDAYFDSLEVIGEYPG